MERCSVVFSSSMGNTKLLSDAIGEALPKENRDYFGEITPEVP
ncbi:MAG: flavodoxin family protein [Oscillospiraceae bacterium]|nr:flavodoxin family protein [Oscillospiraceae bacterium]MCI7487465.1 flavodoxin family protein [Oscillospiraceae bacterium]